MVPPIRNAKSVCFTMLTIGFMVDIYYNLYIYSYNGAFEPTHKTGGHHWIGWKSIVLTLELLCKRFVFCGLGYVHELLYIYIFIVWLHVENHGALNRQVLQCSFSRFGFGFEDVFICPQALYSFYLNSSNGMWPKLVWFGSSLVDHPTFLWSGSSY